MLAWVFAVLLAFQGAPPDVPKGHWAYRAVDELFSAGILHGYPSSRTPLRLEKIKPDDAWLRKQASAWKQHGLLVGYPDGMCGPRPPSNYEQAVAMHAAWAMLVALSSDVNEPSRVKQELQRWIPGLAKAICMREPELTKLGADVPEMIRALERMRGTRFDGQ